MRTIAELKAEKERQRMSYDKLAELSGVPKTTLTNILLGYTQTVNTENYQAIERALGFTDEEKVEEHQLSDEEKQLVSLIAELTDEEVKELSNFVDYIISKREK